jgi:transcriptional regulator with XRE-family HTH domain
MISKEEKEYIKLKFGLCLKRILDSKKTIADNNKLDGIKDHKLISSLRKLESATGLRFATLQEITVGKANATFTTIVTIADTLEMTLSEFFAEFDKISEKDVLDYQTELKKQKEDRKIKKKGKKKSK